MNSTPYHIFFGHANGLPAPLYAPLLAGLPKASLHTIPCLGHDRPVTAGWDSLADEVLEAVKDIPRPRLGIGHSVGASAIYGAEFRVPGTFDGIILLEPVVFAPAKHTLVAVLRRLGLVGLLGPAAKTRKRRTSFPDHDTATDYFASRSLFRNLDPACLEAYVRDGLVPGPTGLTLRFSAAVEYAIFCQGPAWFPVLSRAPRLAHWITGQQTKTISKRDLRWTAQQLPGFQADRWPGGHLFPLERPVETASRIRALLAENSDQDTKRTS